MEDGDMEYIRKNIKELIRTTEYRPLLDACVKKKILSDVMRSRIENLTNSDENEKHKELFLKLTKRGPNAYEDLIEVLSQLKFDKAVIILRAPKISSSQYISMHKHNQLTPTLPQPIPNDTEEQPSEQAHVLPEGCYSSKDYVDSKQPRLEPFTKKIEMPEGFVVHKSKVIRYDKKIKIYPMKTRNRGVFFMVNIIQFKQKNIKRRSGAEMDSKYLLCLFQELGFLCFQYENLTMEEFFALLKELRDSKYLEQTESFVMVLMSHGEMKDDMHDRVIFYDGAICKVIEIEDFFANDKCFHLREKPKVFIFPFCRGGAPDSGVSRIQTDGFGYELPKASRNIETRSDMLVCYASVRGFEALRDPKLGSFYIQTFCKELAENAHDTHLEDMLKLVGDRVKNLRTNEGYLQTPAFYNHGFNKLLFFNPGVYDEGDGVKAFNISQ